jgi:hypothetical protein
MHDFGARQLLKKGGIAALGGNKGMEKGKGGKPRGVGLAQKGWGKGKMR